MRLALLVAALLAFTACPPGIRRPESAQLSMTGTISVGGLDRRGDPLPEATVTLVDPATGARLASNATSDTGGYRLSTAVAPEQRVVFVVAAPGYAPAARAFTVGPFTELTVSLSLEPLSPLDCIEAACAAPGEDAWWVAPPPNASGRLHALDLEHQRTVRVDVDDSAPSVLALAFVELDGGVGADGGAPDSTGELALRIPLSGWSALTDAVPDSGVLEAALAWFDPATGRWQALDAGALTSEAGLPLPESALGSVQRLEHAAGVVARAPFVGSGYLAVLGAPSALGCVEGTLDAEGSRALGAMVVVAQREGRVTANGGFCVEVEPGASQVQARALYAGLLYTLADLPRPSAPGRCGTGCTQAGTLTIAADALVAATLCELSGTVEDSQGTPVPMAQVVMFDDSLVGATFDTFCGKLGTRCQIATASGDDGRFTLKAPLATRLLLSAGATLDSSAGPSQRSGALVLTECPTAPVTLKLDHGLAALDVTATYAGDTIAWSPPRAASHLVVTDALGAPKWEIQSPLGFTPPVTLGQAPAGAQVLTPLSGAAATDDLATVELAGTGRDGVQYAGAASATRP